MTARPIPALSTLAAIVPFAVFLGVYGPAAGHGFITDDFGWILQHRVRSLAEIPQALWRHTGFFRPIVALSFTIDEWLFGLSPRPYGLTNVALAALGGWGIYSLARALSLRGGAGLFAAGLWLLNFHGINMAILWISGRTALLLTLAATLTASAALRGRLGSALGCLALALLSKEEAIMLPAIVGAWLYVLRPEGSVPVARWVASSTVVTAAYLGVRTFASALTPSSAPGYYRFSFDFATLARNAAEYADRALTTPLAVVVLLALLTHPAWRRGAGEGARIALAAALWIAGAYAITVFLPVRSSLYACLPAVGACIGAAALASRWWDLSSEPARRRLVLAAILVPVLLAPVYHARTERWVSIADFSGAVLPDLVSLTRRLPDGAVVVIDDDRGPRANMASAFSVHVYDAYLLAAGRPMTIWIEPPLPLAATAGVQPPCADCIDLRLRIRAGRIEASTPEMSR